MTDADTQAQFDAETGRLHNQFNFNDRAVQTKVSRPQDAMMMTEPPPSKDAGGSMSQWRIFDAYKAHQEKGSRAAEDQAKARSAVARRGIGELASTEDPAKEEEKQSRQEMERMTRLYWDDPADAIQQREGTLLPLWRFTAAAAHGLHVTALCWNPAYPDLFAAGYGSFNAQRQGPGAAICFSLKDPVNPIFERHTASGVMSLDFHPQQGNILAMGLYSGNIEVHNVMSKDSSQPLYKTSAAAGKHLYAVTAVRWLNGASAGLRGLMFYSTSADGHVYQWLLGKSAMTFQEFYTLRADPDKSKSAKASAWDSMLQNAAPPYGATCMDFHKDQGHILLIGTEEGRMQRCSTALAEEALSTYTGHSDPVYCVHWNRRHPDIFLSTSADWTLKLWLSSRSQAMMTFDLGCPVGDAAWAPYSATVFAAVGDDGCVQVFDLAANKRDPVSKQKIHAKAGLTRISFNTHHPVLLIGDDRGCVHCLKLSPNLRKQPRPTSSSGAPAKSSGASVQPILTVDPGIQQLDAIFLVALKSMVTEENQDKITEELKIIQDAWQQAKAT
ncbi:g7529 [Coccomyxa viridis]|uniref:G7529 protein n=1 Tax=Coccomyxa viridis TaxID=1274662 RepID=A0ABP1FZ74_9CHLO